MPTVFRYRGFRFFFYANEGTPREPLNIHASKGGHEAKLWLNPDVHIAYNDGFNARVLRELLKTVDVNKIRIEEAWHEFFS